MPTPKKARKASKTKKAKAPRKPRTSKPPQLLFTVTLYVNRLFFTASAPSMLEAVEATLAKAPQFKTRASLSGAYREKSLSVSLTIPQLKKLKASPLFRQILAKRLNSAVTWHG